MSNVKETEVTWVCRAIFVLLAMAPVCQPAPSIRSKLSKSWREDNELPTAVLDSTCDPATGRCLDWMPIIDAGPYGYEVEQDQDFERVQPLHVREVDRREKDPWIDRSVSEGVPMVGGSSINQLTSKPTKKDIFSSRGWNAGGMPFSVLYMSPRTHPPPLSSGQTDANKDTARKNNEAAAQITSSSGSRKGQTNRVTQRNGQPRRHYSIIPQLFVSYGWGPSGK
ncbi:hypothetical protein QAD02_016169 [Eretmocerus hayati]|uniref:Uncharacterized protein n=1 Tax=Eretmocerus hayati TaxID=131215 RepID=A0ACC2PD83_9HYME|nr:hypothetical protein QAD02_016169 [Eretmocerus hayati]